METKESRVNPLYEKSKKDITVEISGIVFAMLFITEFLLRIIAQGFFIHKKSYMRYGWNILDFLIVLISIFELF